MSGDARTVRPGHEVTYHNEPTELTRKLDVEMPAKLKLAHAIKMFRALTDEQRIEVMAECCSGCGRLDPRCTCMRED